MPAKRLQILLVEDDAVDRMAIEHSIREQDLPYDLSTAASIREALERLETSRPDLVLLDYVLGDGTALELLPSLEETPAVVITGGGDEAVAVEAMKRGAYDYLTKDPDRDYLKMLAPTVRNVLARRRAEEALHDSQERLKAIIESQPDLIFEAGTDARVSFMSPACREVLGREPEQVIGRPLHELAAEPHRGRARQMLDRLIRDGGELRFFHLTLGHADGTERDMSVNARPFFDRRGQPLGVRGSIRDVTEYRQTLDALHETQALATRAQRELAEARVEAVRLHGHLGRNTDFEGLVGRHPRMMELYDKVRLAAATDVTVHVSGPSGSGKELVAHALHNLSPRRGRPFVVVNCSAIPETLVESTLFGHVKGAFSGAVTDAGGYLGRAQGGTLFLDEIGELAPLIQVKLLRFLQEHTYERVGDSTPRSADVRIVTATNRDLWTLVREDRMREDFYYRISVFPLAIPPLAERRSDIALLAEHFLRRISERMGKRVSGVSQSVMEAFDRHLWPGNVRELENVLEYACVVATSSVIRSADLPPHFHDHTARIRVGRTADDPEHLRDVLERSGWNRTQAARTLGISRVTLWKRMKAAGIHPPDAAGGRRRLEAGG